MCIRDRRSWFRDLFNTQVDTQKLGGYDPYMNEFVLSANNIALPIEEVCIECGITGQYLVQLNNELEKCYELGTTVGEVNIDYNIINITGNEVLNATYNGVTETTGPVSTSGTLTFNKSLANTTTFDLQVVSSGSVEIEFTVNCPEEKQMGVVYICATSDLDSDDTIHNDFNWEQSGFSSPVNSQAVTFLSGAGNPVVSYYQINSGVQGVGNIPPDGSTVTMAFNKYSQDDATFDINTNTFRYLRSNTLYANTPQAVAQAIAASSVASPIDSSLAPDYYKADFTVPSGSEQYLYIIYDYRTPTAIDLCVKSTLADSCCNCDETPT